MDDGQLAKAEDIGLQVLSIRARILGIEHHHSLTSMEHLAAIYRRQERLIEAEELKTQITEARNKLEA